MFAHSQKQTALLFNSLSSIVRFYVTGLQKQCPFNEKHTLLLLQGTGFDEQLHSVSSYFLHVKQKKEDDEEVKERILSFLMALHLLSTVVLYNCHSH